MTMSPRVQDINQRGAEYPAWLSLCLAVGARNYVEVGCGVGRGCNLARSMGLAKVIGIDLSPKRPAVWEEQRPGDSDLIYISGYSSDPLTVHRVLEILQAPPDAVFIDADHHYSSAEEDFKRWWPDTRLIVGFHDILMDGADTVGLFWNTLKYDTRSLELLSRDKKSVVEWMGQGALDASTDGKGYLTAGGIGILFREENL